MDREVREAFENLQAFVDDMAALGDGEACERMADALGIFAQGVRHRAAAIHARLDGRISDAMDREQAASMHTNNALAALEPA